MHLSTKPNQAGKIMVSMLFVALLTLIRSASGQITVTGSSQLGAVPLTPSWTPVTGGLFDGLVPTTATGNFGEYGTGGSANNLTTVGESIQIRSYSGAGNLEMCGSDGTAGSLLVYTLPVSTYGYNITNITVYGGWQDGGRDAQTYEVYYSTVAAPGIFIPLTYANYSPPNPSSQGCATRVVINDLSGGPIAVNVAALKFVFNNLGAQNGAVGYTAITAQGPAATGPANTSFAFTYATRNPAPGSPPSWTIETDSLIAGQLPTTAGAGNFANFGIGSPGLSALTDGTYGNVDSGSSYATCGGANGGCGQSVTYTLTNSPNGSDITNIVTYSGWGNPGRDGQFYHISYSTISAPTTFIPITGVFYDPNSGAPISDRVSVHMSNGGPLARNVSQLKFDWTEQANNMANGGSLYAEIIVEGTNSAPPAAGPSPYLVQDTLPTYAETVVGDQVVFTAAYSNSPLAGLQWQVIKSGVTNNVPGATSATLTLNNVHLSDSGSYMLKATNATDNTALPSYSTPAPLVVSNSPAPVNNVIVNSASQNFPSTTNFFPAWTVNTNGDLIYGFTAGSGPGTFTSAGDFTGGGNYCNADPSILSDGIAASMTSLPNLAFCAGGPHIAGAGEFVTYTLITNSAPYGLDLTNITVFGGWQDAGRDEQKYQVLYSTVQAPGSFVPLLTADYLPTDPYTQPTVSRTTLVPASGVLAHNVAALEINFNVSPEPENGWEGYSEILVGGAPSTGFVPSLTSDVAPSTASDVVGSQLIITAGFGGATSMQWLKNGTNIPGATTSTLAVNNLQSSDAGVYALVASNSVGGNSSSRCTVTVNPAPTAVGNIVTAIATQTSVKQVFTPTWDASQLALSLIYTNSPSSSGDGDFTGGSFTPGGPTGASLPSVLTDGTFGTIDFNLSGNHAWVTCMGLGNLDQALNLRAGQFVVYTLPASAYGYNITNIVTAGGWNDGGRDQQAYTINYATSANPTYFTPLTMVNYNPTNPVGYSMVRATITPASGALVSNVVALEFDMTYPFGENQFSGYSEIAVYGSPSATPPPLGPMITAEHEEYTNSFIVETPNLIANQLPTSHGPGVFTEEGCNETNLTDGVIGFGSAFGASCGDDGIAVPYIVFNSASGWDLTNIVVYTLWHDYGRDGQFYNLSYSTWSAPNTFLPLVSVDYNPSVPGDGRPSGNRVAIAPPLGQTLLASNVYAVKFDFTPQGVQDFGWSGYSEIVFQGSNLALVKPPILGAPMVSGGDLILTGTGGTPNSGYTWLTTTNLSAPIIWTTNSTGTLDGLGSFSNAIPISVTNPARFFRFRIP
jgi:hypothetical protein